jgi:hypothetical protein
LIKLPNFIHEKIIFRSILFIITGCNKSENIAKQEVRAVNKIIQEDKVALSSPVASYASQPSENYVRKQNFIFNTKN